MLLRLMATSCILAACTACTADQVAHDAPWEQWTNPISVGALDGPEREVFGTITDAADVGELGALVLDGINKNVRRVDPGGHVREMYGRVGDGPGEFSDPAFLLVLHPDTVAVVDRGNLSMHWLLWRADGVRFLRSVRLPFWPSAGCAMNGELYLLGLHDGAVIHEIGREGEIRRSIGAVTTPERGAGSDAASAALTRTEMGGGTLVCNQDGGVLAHFTEIRGTYDFYGHSGERLVHGAIPGFAQPTRTFSSGGVRYGLNSETGYVDRVSRAVEVSERCIIVLMERGYGRDKAELDRRLAVTVAVPTGLAGAVMAEAPEILAVSARGAITGVRDPFPRLFIWDRSGERSGRARPTGDRGREC